MNSFLRWLLLLSAALPLLPRGAWAEGSKQLTPNTNNLALTDPANTRSGYLTHNVNFTGVGITNTSLGFLKPSGFSYNSVAFSEDHRMYVRVKADETLLYGIHRTNNGQLAAGTNQRDLTLTLRRRRGHPGAVNHAHA